MAERTGLEPATSGVTGQHSNQLNYRSTLNLVACASALMHAENARPSLKTGAPDEPSGALWVLLAEWTGLEPATSGVTGQHSNQLNYHSALKLFALGADGGC